MKKRNLKEQTRTHKVEINNIKHITHVESITRYNTRYKTKIKTNQSLDSCDELSSDSSLSLSLS